jgi:hypothetical protein
MSESTARAQIDAILAREGLTLSTDDYEWLVALYDDMQSDLQVLHSAELRDEEPAVVYEA